MILSHLDEAIRETHIRRAEGDALVTLGELYGMPMPGGWDEASWREAMLAVALGPRGRPGGTLGFLEGAFTFLAEDTTVTRDKSTPTTRRRISAAPATFAQRHVDRWYRIDGELYLSVGPADVSATDGSYLELCPIATAYTAGCDWGTLAASDSVTATLLGFTYTEPTPGPTKLWTEASPTVGTPCPKTNGKAGFVVVSLYDTLSNPVPPTYMIENGLTGYIGTRTIAQINTLVPDEGWTVVAGDAGTPLLGTDALATGDVATFNGSKWIKRIEGTGGFVTAGRWLVVHETATLYAPLVAADAGSTALFDGTSNTPSALVLPGLGVPSGLNPLARRPGQPFGGAVQGGTFDPPSYGAQDDGEPPPALGDPHDAPLGDHGGASDSAEEEDGDTSGVGPVPTLGGPPHTATAAGSGPFPPYLTGEGAAPGVEAVLKLLLPVGYHAQIKRVLA